MTSRNASSAHPARSKSRNKLAVTVESDDDDDNSANDTESSNDEPLAPFGSSSLFYSRLSHPRQRPRKITLQPSLCPKPDCEWPGSEDPEDPIVHIESCPAVVDGSADRSDFNWLPFEDARYYKDGKPVQPKLVDESASSEDDDDDESGRTEAEARGAPQRRRQFGWLDWLVGGRVEMSMRLRLCSAGGRPARAI